MNIYIIRNNRQYGPYDEQTLLSYVNSGQILLHDKAIVVGESQEQTVKKLFEMCQPESAKARLPFLHACWCGITGYFLAFANLYPKYRKGLYVLAFTIPALIHGLYDSISGWPIVSLFLVFIGLMLLMVYLKQGGNYQSKLRQ